MTRLVIQFLVLQKGWINDHYYYIIIVLGVVAYAERVLKGDISIKRGY